MYYFRLSSKMVDKILVIKANLEKIKMGPCKTECESDEEEETLNNDNSSLMIHLQSHLE